MESISPRTRPVKTLTGTVRWLTTDPALALGQGLPAGLLIRRDCEPADSPGTAYMVRVYLDDTIVLGYRLEKLDGSDVYDIDRDFSSCTCPYHLSRCRL